MATQRITHAMHAHRHSVLLGYTIHDIHSYCHTKVRICWKISPVIPYIFSMTYIFPYEVICCKISPKYVKLAHSLTIVSLPRRAPYTVSAVIWALPPVTFRVSVREHMTKLVSTEQNPSQWLHMYTTAFMPDVGIGLCIFGSPHLEAFLAWPSPYILFTLFLW